MAEIFTIGHSNHSLERFLELLKQHRIEAVCDVRSSPYSRMNPQFNRENLKQSLREVNITYVFLGRELGARSWIRRVTWMARFSTTSWRRPNSSAMGSIVSRREQASIELL